MTGQLGVRANMRVAAAAGCWQGAPPLGYDLRAVPGHENDKRPPQQLTPNPDTAPLVKALFRLADTQRSRKELLAFASKHDLQSFRTRGQPIAWSTISRLLQNPAYLGHVVYGRKQQSEIAELIATNGPVEQEQWTVCENAHEAIIGTDTFNRVSGWLAGRKSRPFYEKQTFFLLDGLVTCGGCGRPMYGHKTVSQGYTYTGYRCRARHERYDCNQPIVSCRQVDGLLKPMMLDGFLSLLADTPEMLLTSVRRGLIDQRAQVLEGSDARRDALTTRKSRAETARKKLLKDYVWAAEAIGKDDVDAQLNEITSELNEIDAELGAMAPAEQAGHEIEDAMAWFESLTADVEAYGAANQVAMVRYCDGGTDADPYSGTAIEVGPVGGKQAIMPLDEDTWRRVTKLLVRKVTITGSSTKGTLHVEWTAQGQALLSEYNSTVRMVQSVRRSGICGRT